MSPRRGTARDIGIALTFERNEIGRVKSQCLAIIFDCLAGKTQLFVAHGDPGEGGDIFGIACQSRLIRVDRHKGITVDQRRLALFGHLHRLRLENVITAWPGCTNGHCRHSGHQQQPQRHGSVKTHVTILDGRHLH